ncbi:acetyltransferase [Sphingobacterium spiritivorum]|uniref:acetyltransferase n=1 Tax=Sphingobacterium spiritivorum TaxID=258 RepID=UPI003DA3D759
MNIRRATPEDYKTIMQIWESAVHSTHDFLREEDFLFFKEAIPRDYLPQLTAYILYDQEQAMGYIAVAEQHLEMLFVDADSRGKGYGKMLLNYAVEQLGVRYVDVNEQNEQAAGFYFRMGFEQTGRSATDGSGKPYPILHLQLQSKEAAR